MTSRKLGTSRDADCVVLQSHSKDSVPVHDEDSEDSLSLCYPSPMFERILRILKALELEEKVLHTGVALSLIALFIPWLGAERAGTIVQWNGFGSYTGFIGHALLLIDLFILAVTLTPLLGGPVVIKKAHRHSVRLLLTGITTILLIGCFTILLRLPSQIPGAEIRFGIYTAIVGSALSTLYAFLLRQEELKIQAQAIFQHPDEQAPPKPKKLTDVFEEHAPPPPPPPTPPPLEEHTLFSERND